MGCYSDVRVRQVASVRSARRHIWIENGLSIERGAGDAEQAVPFSPERTIATVTGSAGAPNLARLRASCRTAAFVQTKALGYAEATGACRSP